MEAGKGDKPRPYSVSQDTFSSNWDRIFGKKKSVTPKIYVFDLDKTILDGPDYYNSTPLPGTVEKINSLYDEGNTIIIYTARGATTGLNWYRVTKESLEKYGIKHHELRMGKLNYDVWVDDKAINNKDFFN